MNNNIQNQKTLDEMINHIAEEKNIRQLLTNYEIADIKEIHTVKHYERDNNRLGLIVDIKENNRIEKTRILIDLRMGQPSVHQVYDALYDIGKDCDIRIIIHTNGWNDFDRNIPSVDDCAVLSLISQLQEDKPNIIPIDIHAIWGISYG